MGAGRCFANRSWAQLVISRKDDDYATTQAPKLVPNQLPMYPFGPQRREIDRLGSFLLEIHPQRLPYLTVINSAIVLCGSANLIHYPALSCAQFAPIIILDTHSVTKH